MPALFIHTPLLPFASSKAPSSKAACRNILDAWPPSLSFFLFSSSRRLCSSTSRRRSFSALRASSAFLTASCLACAAFCLFSFTAVCCSSTIGAAIFSATPLDTWFVSIMCSATPAKSVCGLLSSDRETFSVSSSSPRTSSVIEIEACFSIEMSFFSACKATFCGIRSE